MIMIYNNQGILIHNHSADSQYLLQYVVYVKAFVSQTHAHTHTHTHIHTHTHTYIHTHTHTYTHIHIHKSVHEHCTNILSMLIGYKIKLIVL